MSNTEEQKKKHKAIKSFGQSAEIYHQEAKTQQKVARGLISSLLPWRDILPPGPILEVGCGTGFLTEHLVKEFPNRELVITDAAPEMIQFTKKRFQDENILEDHHSFKVLDIDSDTIQPEEYALVISNFTAQWFDDTPMGLEKLGYAVKPGGLLLGSFPGNQSFEEWYKRCLELGLPYTANPLPDVEEVVIKLSMGPFQIDYYENDLYEEFNSSLEFFQRLKRTGAAESTTGKSLSAKQFRLLTRHWDEDTEGKLKVKWHVVYLAAKKDAN